jgi:predicted PurR-regulated permease PerM
MTPKSLQVYFFLALFAGAIVLLFLVFRPFIPLLLFAGILALLMWPVYDRLRRFYFGNRTLAAFSTVFLTFLLILTPLAFLTISLVMEAIGLVTRLRSQTDFAGIEAALSKLLAPEQAAAFTEQARAALSGAAEFVQPALAAITSNVVAIFSNTVSVIFGVAVTLLAMYYFLKDGEKLKKELIDISPLEDKYDALLFDRISAAVSAVAYGEFVVAIVKGTVAGVLFLVLGLPSPVFWGTMVALANFLPVIGTATVTVPFALYLFLSGQYTAGIIFTVAAVLVIGLVDNFVTPQVIRTRIHIHPLLILFSLLGGILLFGFVGLFFGPIILSVTFALVDIYKQEFRPQITKM